MLLQSHGGVLRLLPALPDYWAKGHINGLRARGNMTVDQAWNAGRLSLARITAHAGGKIRICYTGIGEMDVTDDAGNKAPVSVIDADNIELTADAGGVYAIVNPEAGVNNSVAAAGIEITFSDGIARTNADDALIEAFDTAGRRMASGRKGYLDLREMTPGSMVILKAVNAEGSAVRKAVL